MGISKKNTYILLALLAFFFYSFYYKRYFIYNDNKDKVFTIWKINKQYSYIIPGMYFSPFKPKRNYLYLSNQKIIVIFQDNNDLTYSVGVYYKENKIEDSRIIIYKDKDAMLFESGILDSIDWQGRKIYSGNVDSLKESLEYKLIDLNRIYGIKVFEN